VNRRGFLASVGALVASALVPPVPPVMGFGPAVVLFGSGRDGDVTLYPTRYWFAEVKASGEVLTLSKLRDAWDASTVGPAHARASRGQA